MSSQPKILAVSAEMLASCVLSMASGYAHAIQAATPPGFSGKLHVVIDSGVVRPDNVTIEMRPPQGQFRRRM